MPTNKVQLRTVEEFMSDFQPVYKPLFPLFLDKSQAHTAEVGEAKFKRAEAVGDIRAHRITPKDTAIKQIAVGEGSKTFKKYFLANQFILSQLKSREGAEDVIAQVLDEHNKQADDLLLLGEGTSAGTVQNNGLYWSADPNYRLESSAAVAAGTASDHLKDMHSKLMATVALGDHLSGRKALIIYGSTAGTKLDSLYANTDRPFKGVLSEVLGSEISVVKLPSAVTPSSANGWILVNLDQVKLHYIASGLPKLADQGVNDEKLYAWFNFLLGSMMLEVLADDAIVRQPVTFA